MKLMIFLFLLALLMPLGAQLWTHYTPLPALARDRRREWAWHGRRWGLAIMVVRIA